MSVAHARIPLRAVARQEIEALILSGALRPGDQLKLHELAATLGLGLTPLREAMIEVVRDGLLESRPGRGFFVPALTLEEAEQLYPLISTLEVLAVRTTGAFTHAHLARLRRINEHFARVEGDAVRALELDSEWHANLVNRCGNPLLLDMLGGVKRRAERYQLAFQRSAGHWATSIRHHEDIVAALERGARDEAADLLVDNWAPGPRFVAAWLEE